MVSTIKLELRAFVAILIVIVITVPTAYYFLSKPYNPPITVQNGFGEYNWTSDRFNNASFTTIQNSVNLSDAWSNAIIYESNNVTSMVSIHGWESNSLFHPNGSILTPANCTSEFQVAVYYFGKIAPDLHPSRTEAWLNSSLPSYSFDGTVNGTEFYPFLVDDWSYDRNMSLVNTHGPLTTAVFDFNESRNSSVYFHFSTGVEFTFSIINMVNNTTYPVHMTFAMYGLQEPVYNNFTLNIRAED